ncbi:ATP-binding protein [Nocardioides sp. C4-1]|uniref:ATP-binding SpoIIE family protein phosphatase n=1 Tax=Nocardioides sp. C4-1 TaxID=3151851 RepID=UPI003265BB86
MIDDPMEEILSVLQDVVLPAGVPVVPDFETAARFSIAADVGESSGAWFDVLPADDGRLTLVLGQVPGSGMVAVAAASAAAAVLRASLRHSGDLATALSLLETHAAMTPDARGTVLAVATVDPHDRVVTYAVAGHDGPVVSPRGGAGRRLGVHGPALGHGVVPSVALETLADGDVVALELGVTDLPAQLDHHRAESLEATCDAVSEQVMTVAERGVVAVVAAGLPGRRTADLMVRLPHDELASRRARHELGEWLERCGATAMDSLSVVQATGELIANALEHAYPARDVDAVVELRACHRPSGEVVVEVVDHGHWRRETDEAGRGRGLAMAAGLVSGLEVVTGPDGTRGRVSQPLGRPVAVRRHPVVHPPEAVVDIHRDAPDRLRLTGDFGHDEVERVGHELGLATRGGTRPVVLDLSDLVAVSAGALRLLGDLVATDHGPTRVELRARQGSVAQRELTRAGIAHDAS